jgi:hypothetical protein
MGNLEFSQSPNLEIEPEEEAVADQKGPYVLPSEVAKSTKEMRDRKAAGDDDVPGNVLVFLREHGLKLKTQLFNSIHETGD